MTIAKQDLFGTNIFVALQIVSAFGALALAEDMLPVDVDLGLKAGRQATWAQPRVFFEKKHAENPGPTKMVSLEKMSFV